MSYSKWFEQHKIKHKKIVDKLLSKNYTKEQIVDYFLYENMQQNEIDFCPLYAKNKKCHDIDELNCYLCACPNFRFDDNGIKQIDGKTQYSFCNIDSKYGRQGIYSEKIHQDCSGCNIPHGRFFVLKNFDLDWEKIMSKCKVCNS